MLQGFVRCKAEHKDKVFDHTRKDGLFIDQLASAGEPRQAVRLISVNDQEDPKTYLARVAEIADKMNRAVAHRRGGGNFPGVRLAKGKVEPTARE